MLDTRITVEFEKWSVAALVQGGQFPFYGDLHALVLDCVKVLPCVPTRICSKGAGRRW